MADRAKLLRTFLADTGRAGWARSPLAGDASNRRYDRLRDPVTGRSEVLMDAPPATGEDVTPFITIARHLRALGLAAPEIIADDPENGFLLIEDFGDAVFARVLDTDPALETELYRHAADVLLKLHRHPPPPGLPRFAIPMEVDFLTIAHAWYRPGATGHLPDSAAKVADLMNRALADHADDQSVMILRDFHAENLIWQPQRAGTDRVGLLDFQDAMAGYPAYDLISLLADARRDVAPATRAATIAYFIDRSGTDPDAFRTALAVLGAQRNLRILGVFARLCLCHGKARYVDLLPRVWGHLMADLEHPTLADLKTQVLADLPPPDAPHRQELKARCATVPMP
ncbi:aminoglycoside phosphotransferase family protein [Oceaniglobus indicus]|uniref:aminoglycoside phosphotransferase family protein n=1 Tax=Oceaniglobus indicus TaxID=2047749 RepID=UPI000C18FCCE|nr:phosphotransferase [Oceaniglobus indicus]